MNQCFKMYETFCRNMSGRQLLILKKIITKVMAESTNNTNKNCATHSIFKVC